MYRELRHGKGGKVSDAKRPRQRQASVGRRLSKPNPRANEAAEAGVEKRRDRVGQEKGGDLGWGERGLGGYQLDPEWLEAIGAARKAKPVGRLRSLWLRLRTLFSG